MSPDDEDQWWVEAAEGDPWYADLQFTGLLIGGLVMTIALLLASGFRW